MNPQTITNHLTEVKDYIASINQTALDINALYILQAYLTVSPHISRNYKPASGRSPF